MTATNTENSTKKKKNGSSKTSKTESSSVVDKQEETKIPEVKLPELNSEEVAEISFLPTEIQAILVSFKGQLKEAPTEIREIIGKFLFGPVYFEKDKSNGLSEEDKKIITASFDDVALPDGFQNLPPIMIYSASANDFAPIRALAVDVLQWGSRPVIIARSSSPVKVMSSEGKIVQIPPKMVFAILAESDLVGFVRHLNEDPEGSYEIFFAPSCIQKDDSGNSIVRYKVAIGTRVPKSAVWPPK